MFLRCVLFVQWYDHFLEVGIWARPWTGYSFIKFAALN
jgi:hypothetical protein